MEHSKSSKLDTDSHYSHERREHKHSHHRYHERSRDESRDKDTYKLKVNEKRYNENQINEEQTKSKIINNYKLNNIIFKEQRSEEEIKKERNKRKAKAQLLLMLENEEKIKAEENKIKKELEDEDSETEKVNSHADDENDPLDVFMEDLYKNNKIEEQVENFDIFENKENQENNNGEKVSDNIDNKLLNKPPSNLEKEEQDYSYHENLDKDNDQIVIYENNENNILNYKNYNNKEKDEVEQAWRKIKDDIDKDKELPAVDHSKINYDYFIKNIYIESPEISKLTDDEVSEIRKKNGSILVRGKNIPKPILNFYDCGLNSVVLEVLDKKNIKKPFPIQMQTIPVLMTGKDCLGVSETGSGKTLAYVLPLIRHIQTRIAGIESNNLENGMIKGDKYTEIKSPIGLIIVPTRELAIQIYEVIRSFTRFLNIAVACIYGGTNLSTQIGDLKGGVDAIVATPARLIELLSMSRGKVCNLYRTTFIVLDEADRLFDLGFGPQITKIVNNARPTKQICMFSATFPIKIETFARKILKKPIEILVGQRGQINSKIKQKIILIPKEQTFLRLLEIIDSFMNEESNINKTILIFTEKQNEVTELWKQLYIRGFDCCAINSQMDQEDRINNLNDFKNGLKNILISTSVTSRGINIENCGMVINFRCPNHMEDYIHRIGRTGRAGQDGLAYTFVDPKEDDLYAEYLIKVLEINNQEIPDELKEMSKNYRKKLLSGNAEKVRINGYLGNGYKFNKYEKEKGKLNQKLLIADYANNEEDGDVINQIKMEDENNNDELLYENTQNKYKLLLDESKDVKQDINCTDLVLKEKLKNKERFKLIKKDNRAKQLALDVGMKTAKSALLAGKTEEETIPMVQDAINKALANYNPNTNLKTSTENAAKIIESWELNDNIKNNIFTMEFYINDYPVYVRERYTKKDFLNHYCDIYDVDISIRGTYFNETAKTALPGHKNIHLFIKGQKQQNVNQACEEIKKMFDELALNYYTHYAKGYSLAS